MHFKVCSYSSGSKSDLNKRIRNGCPSKLDCTPIYRFGIEGELEVSEEEDSEVERRTELVGELWNDKHLVRTCSNPPSGTNQTLGEFLMIDYSESYNHPKKVQPRILLSPLLTSNISTILPYK